jgi:hypothetical protein
MNKDRTRNSVLAFYQSNMTCSTMLLSSYEIVRIRGRRAGLFRLEQFLSKPMKRGIEERAACSFSVAGLDSTLSGGCFKAVTEFAAGWLTSQYQHQ